MWNIYNTIIHILLSFIFTYLPSLFFSSSNIHPSKFTMLNMLFRHQIPLIVYSISPTNDCGFCHSYSPSK